MSVIKDGTGGGHVVKVDSANRIHTSAETVTHEINHTIEGHGYNIETPVITLTTAGKSGVLYLKNNEDKDIIITGFFNLMGEVTGTTSGNIILEYEYNTAGGTLISSVCNTITPTNKRIGSTNSIDVTALYGAEGKTVDSGLSGITSLSTSTGRNTLLVQLTLPKNQSISVSITPFTGTSNVGVIAALDCYIVD